VDWHVQLGFNTVINICLLSRCFQWFRQCY